MIVIYYLTLDYDFKSIIKQKFYFIADEIGMSIIGICSKHN